MELPASLQDVSDRYEIRETIGRGGMATVHLATDKRHGRSVALKVLDSEFGASVGPERFLREISIAAQLQHPNIVPLHDSGESNGVLYYVMPYVEGETLRERLAREGQLPVEQAVRIALDVAGALQYAHEQGVVHRDIKPANILLSRDKALLADFGVARALTLAEDAGLTATGHAVGTPAYMSPEQGGAAQSIDGRSDVYSLGCVVYEMLAGEPPFTGPTAQAVVARHMYAEPPELRIIRPGVPAAISSAIETALQKAPADRYETPADFAQALQVGFRPRRRQGLARVMKVVAALVVLLTGGIGIHRLTSSNLAPLLDGNRVAAFPLVANDPTLASSGAGWNVALAIGTALEHAQPLQFIDGREWLAAAQQSQVGTVSPDTRREVSRARGARYYTSGVIRLDADSLLSVIVRLHDVADGSMILQQTASGLVGATNVESLGLEAISRILPTILEPSRRVDFSPLTNRTPGSIALAIQGDRHYRAARFANAHDFYQRAVAEDSLAAFAAVKGAQAASWLNRYGDAESLAAIAASHDSLLSEKYQLFVRGWQHFLWGQADSAVSRLSTLRETEPDWSEAALALGEVYYHLMPSFAPSDSLASVQFEAALEADSLLGPALFHTAEISLRRGALPEARASLRRLQSVRSTGTWVRRVRLMIDCLQEGPTPASWDSVAESHPADALAAARSLSVAGAALDCGRAGFVAVRASTSSSPAHRWGAFVGLQSAMIAQGDYDAAYELLDSAQTAGSTGVYSLWVFNALAGLPFEAEAQAADELAAQYTGPFYEGAAPATRWLLGARKARSGDIETLQGIVHAFVKSEASDARPSSPASALSALGLLATGDTSAAIGALLKLGPEVVPDSVTWSMTGHLAHERFTLASLLNAVGEHAQAIRVASSFDHQGPTLHLAYLRPSLELRRDAARAAGDVRKAEAYALRLEALTPDHMELSLNRPIS